MRLWTLHPKYLDPKGLVALWRETLLAQQVLRGCTRGYRNHPQLIRFRAQADPLAAITAYLRCIHAESLRRNYAFDATKLGDLEPAASIPETEGQSRYEWWQLLSRLAVRAPAISELQRHVELPEPDPLFRIVPGPIAAWEHVK